MYILRRLHDKPSLALGTEEFQMNLKYRHKILCSLDANVSVTVCFPTLAIIDDTLDTLQTSLA